MGRVPGTGTGYRYQNYPNFWIWIRVFFYVGSDTGTTRILNFRIRVEYRIIVTQQLPEYSGSDTGKI
jgi:hypothetical protein